MKLLPAVLSFTAGSVDVISFLGLGGLFTAHITGNLVILASHIVDGGEAPVAPMLSVPVFMVVLGLTRLLVGGLESPLVHLSLKGAPTTAVMTTNVTRFVMDVGKVLFGGDPADVAKARDRAARTMPVIAGFAVGCGLGAACEAALDLWSLALPASLALLAFAMGFAAEPARENGP
jgi:uncharacterized membrane protein YoaK (UPF0700 family)